MAWSLTEIREILVDLKATYRKLILTSTTERDAGGRKAVEKQMGEVRKQIDDFHALEITLDPSAANETSYADVGGVAFADCRTRPQ